MAQSRVMQSSVALRQLSRAVISSTQSLRSCWVQQFRAPSGSDRTGRSDFQRPVARNVPGVTISSAEWLRAQRFRAPSGSDRTGRNDCDHPTTPIALGPAMSSAQWHWEQQFQAPLCSLDEIGSTSGPYFSRLRNV